VGTITLSSLDHIGVLELARPHKLNAINSRVARETFAAISALSADPDVRVVMVCGKGRAFCSGADLAEQTSTPARESSTISTPITPT
jgi:enoyl-CoA hydratase